MVKGLVDGLDGDIIVSSVHADDDVELTRALGDHFHIDLGIGQGLKELGRGPNVVAHILPHHGNQGDVCFYGDVVGVAKGLDFVGDSFFLALELVVGDN